MSYPQTSFRGVRFAPDTFWGEKRKTISAAALMYQLDILKSTGRYDAFKLQWHPIYDDPPEIWPVPKHLFWDSDVAKWIEGACYFLHEQEDALVRQSVDELVNMIREAQQPDGYLNIHFTVVEPGKRFTNLRDLHELYNAGHLIEAALAHEQLTGSTKLLDPIIRYTNLLAATFGPETDKIPGYPGHPEIELALLRLYARTGDTRHFRLAKFFLTERGSPESVDGKHYYEYEAIKRGEREHEIPDYYPARKSYWYQQAHQPIIEQQTIEGHSVRAMYLLTAVADLVRMDGPKLDGAYRESLFRLWKNMVQKKMYLIGGIGAIKQWEGFGEDYFLPQSTDEGGCYAETCAAIGVMMTADRLLELDLRGSYGDIMELALYNAVLTGVSCDGKSWTYVNQLASSDTDLSERSKWFTVACCPPNVLRLLGNLGGYLYSTKVLENTASIVITLYAGSEISIPVNGQEVKIMMQTKWPLDGQVSFEIVCPPSVQVDLKLRIPGWVEDAWTLTPKIPNAEVIDGYLTLDKTFIKSNTKFVLNCPMKPCFVSPHPYTGQTIAALQRGPLMYCVEDYDNTWVKDHFKNLTLVKPELIELSESPITRDNTTGEDLIKVTAHNAAFDSDPASWAMNELPGRQLAKPLTNGHHSKPLKDLCFVPYYFRANRGGKGHMRVGIKYQT